MLAAVGAVVAAEPVGIGARPVGGVGVHGVSVNHCVITLRVRC